MDIHIFDSNKDGDEHDSFKWFENLEELEAFMSDNLGATLRYDSIFGELTIDIDYYGEGINDK